MYKRDLLLKEAVHPLAKFLNYEVFQDYTCERANIFFQTIVKPLNERSSEEKGGEDVEMENSNYPFQEFFKWYLQIEDLFEGMSTQKEIKERKDELWQILQGIFSDLQEVMPYENLRDETERIKFRLCTTQNALFALTIDELAQ